MRMWWVGKCSEILYMLWYIADLGGIDAYHKLLDSLSSVADGFDSEGEAWDVDWDGLGDPLASCYDRDDGY